MYSDSGMARSSSSVGSCSGVKTLAVLLTMVHPLSSNVMSGGRAQSTTCASAGSDQTLFQTPRENLLGQFTSYKYHFGIRLFTRKPGLSGLGTHHHVHALEQHAAVNAFQEQNALVAQQVRPINLYDAAQEFFQAFRVKRPIGSEHKGADFILVCVMMVMAVVAAVLATFTVVIMMVVI